jgi:hypothetical protein
MSKIKYSSGVNEVMYKDLFDSIEFIKVYQPCLGYMGVQINAIYLPTGYEDKSEFHKIVCEGLFNLDANPTTIWFENQKGPLKRSGFEVKTPRDDLGKNKFYIDNFTYETEEKEFLTFSKQEEISTEEAMKRLTNLSRISYKERAMRIRKIKQKERIKDYNAYKASIGPTLKRMRERIALGTNVAEDWEITL